MNAIDFSDAVVGIIQTARTSGLDDDSIITGLTTIIASMSYEWDHKHRKRITARPPGWGPIDFPTYTGWPQS